MGCECNRLVRTGKQWVRKTSPGRPEVDL